MKNNYSFSSMVKRYVSASVALIISTILALVIANSPYKDAYFAFWQQEVLLSIGDFNFFNHNGHPMTMLMVINEFLMAIFFLFMGLGLKRELLVGELSVKKKAILPFIGACGGMLVPAIIFWLACPNDPDMMRGVEIPTATDIAFSLGLLTVFDKRVPPGMKVFIATLAVADDLCSIIVNDFGNIIKNIFFNNVHTDYSNICLMVVCITMMITANRLGIHKKNFYLIIGILLWYLMLNSGIHATIAGIIIAFLVPASIRSKHSALYIERIRMNIMSLETSPGVYSTGRNTPTILSKDDIYKLHSIESSTNKLISPLQELEDNLYKFIGYIVMPLFAFANMGIDFSTMSLADITGGVSLVIMTSLVFGKFIGVFTFSWAAIKCKIAQLPEGCSWKAFASVCMLCGTGFTISIFTADISYATLENGMQYLLQAKTGVLCGSLISATLGCALLYKNLPKNRINSNDEE